MTLPPVENALSRADFRDVHATRLHGFALLVTHGDQDAAAHLTDVVLAAHGSRASVTQHPEREAAALRADLLRRARRLRRPPIEPDDRAAALNILNVDASAALALGALDVRARGALVAADVERFRPEDLAMILGTSTASARRAVRHARRRYMASHPGPLPGGPRPLRTRIAEIVARTLGPEEESRS